MEDTIDAMFTASHLDTIQRFCGFSYVGQYQDPIKFLQASGGGYPNLHALHSQDLVHRYPSLRGFSGSRQGNASCPRMHLCLLKLHAPLQAAWLGDDT